MTTMCKIIVTASVQKTQFIVCRINVCYTVLFQNCLYTQNEMLIRACCWFIYANLLINKTTTY